MRLLHKGREHNKNKKNIQGEFAEVYPQQKTPRKARGLQFESRFGLVGQNRQKQERHDISDLDHWVHGRAGCILVRIANRIAGHRGFVSF